MPKQKTRKSAAKRLRLTASGKLKYKKGGAGHLLGSKSRKRKRSLRKAGILSKPEEKRLKSFIHM